MRPSVWVVPGYLVATLAVTWPLARAFRTALPAVFNSIDPLLQTFILGWDRHAFATGLLRVFDAPIFFPERRTLTYMDSLLGEALACGIAFRWPGMAPLPWKRAALAAGLALLAMLPCAWPYWQEHVAMAGFTRRLGKAALYSADLLDYVRVNRENALGRVLHL